MESTEGILKKLRCLPGRGPYMSLRFKLGFCEALRTLFAVNALVLVITAP